MRIFIIPEVTKIDAMYIDTKINVSEEGFIKKRTMKKGKQYLQFPSYDCRYFFYYLTPLLLNESVGFYPINSLRFPHLTSICQQLGFTHILYIVMAVIFNRSPSGFPVQSSDHTSDISCTWINRRHLVQAVKFVKERRGAQNLVLTSWGPDYLQSDRQARLRESTRDRARPRP